MTENKIIFHQRLKELLRENDLSLKELSGKTGVPLKTLYHWQSGQVPQKIVHVRRVAIFFGTSIDDLYFGKSSNEQNEIRPLPRSPVREPGSLVLNVDQFLLEIPIKVDDI